MARKQNVALNHMKPNSISADATSNETVDSVFPSTSDSKDVAITEIESSLKKSAFMQKRPILDHQISILSTDSGILPREIQESSFVDDVIKDLNSKGISHAELFCQDHQDSGKETELHFHMGSFSVHSTESVKCDDDGPPPKKKQMSQMGSTNFSMRQKNNEASRRSRASRKHNSMIKEEQIACLEAENKRLTILLNDFTSIAASCKQWIVQKMDNDL